MLETFNFWWFWRIIWALCYFKKY